jgi:hypothetical protein
VEGVAGEPGQGAEGFQAGGYVDGRVGVDGATAAVVAGVERGQEIHYFGAADLADDQAVGAHAEGLADQVAQRDLSGAFDVRRASLEADDVWMIRAEFAGVLDQDQPFGRIRQREQGIEQRRLARARAAADEEGQAGVEEVSEDRRTAGR